MKYDLSKVKIDDIARLAGVSAGTVDRVLHNRGEVSAKTRERVLAVINKLDYRPDIVASTLASKRALKFVSLTPAVSMQNLFWKEPLKGIEKAMHQVHHFGINYQQYHFEHYNEGSFRRSLETIRNVRPDGVILTPAFEDATSAFVEHCVSQNIRVVFLNMNIDELNRLSFVGQNPEQSGRVAAHLLEFGVNPGASMLIVNIMNETGGNAHLCKREKGFRSYFDGSATPPMLDTINICCNDTELNGASLLQTLTNERDRKRPSAIFVTNSRVFHIARLIEQHHPKNILLAGYDLLDENIMHLRNRTIDFLISQNPVEQGYRALMSLYEALVLRRNVPENQYLPIDIITRENIEYYINHQQHETTEF